MAKIARVDDAYAKGAPERRKVMTAQVARSKEAVRAIERERDAYLAPHERAEEILRALNDAGAEYLIVGGYAFGEFARNLLGC